MQETVCEVCTDEPEIALARLPGTGRLPGRGSREWREDSDAPLDIQVGRILSASPPEWILDTRHLIAVKIAGACRRPVAARCRQLPMSGVAACDARNCPLDDGRAAHSLRRRQSSTESSRAPGRRTCGSVPVALTLLFDDVQASSTRTSGDPSRMDPIARGQARCSLADLLGFNLRFPLVPSGRGSGRGRLRPPPRPEARKES